MSSFISRSDFTDLLMSFITLLLSLKVFTILFISEIISFFLATKLIARGLEESPKTLLLALMS